MFFLYWYCIVSDIPAPSHSVETDRMVCCTNVSCYYTEIQTQIKFSSNVCSSLSAISISYLLSSASYWLSWACFLYDSYPPSSVILVEFRLNIVNTLPVYPFCNAVLFTFNVVKIQSATYSPDTCISCLHSIYIMKYLFSFQFTLVIFSMIFLALCPKFIFSPTYFYHIYTIHHLYFFHIPISNWLPVTHP